MYKLGLYLLLMLPLGSWAQNVDEMGGRIEAHRADGQVVAFPNLKTDFKVDIQGDLVNVDVIQQFHNPLAEALNVQYLFPLNQDAAVHQMEMRVGDEIIRAQIDEVKAAEKTFTAAKQAGKSAALLKQARPNMFTQDIANLMPDMLITVKLSYVQTLDKTEGDYQLVLPLVVGPRFQPAHAGVESNADSSTQAGNWQLEQLPDYPPVPSLSKPEYIDPERVSIEIQLNAGMEIQQLQSRSHQLQISAPDKQQRQIKLAANRVIDNQDFVLSYRLAGANTQAGLLSNHDGKQGYFSVLLEPPAVPNAAQISAREMVFVLDCSGSMSGQPLDASKAFMRKALQQLRPSDSFRIIRFSDSVTEFSSAPMPATQQNIQAGIRYTNHLHGDGGTYMSSGIKQALSVPVPKGAIRLVTFLTDGYIGNETEILRMIRQLIGQARLFSIGVGAGPNRYLLDEMAHMGRGFSRYIDPTSAYEAIVEELSQRLQSPVLTDIQIDWGDLQVSDVMPVKIPDLFAGQSVRIQGRYQRGGKERVQVKGRVKGAKATLPLVIDLANQPSDSGQAVSLLWARAAIKQRMRWLNSPFAKRPNNLSDTQLQTQITELGLSHALVTRWTAFVAVSEQVYNQNPSQAQSTQVPLPAVKGVSSKAYSNPSTTPRATQPAFSGKAAPEPAFIFGLLMMVLIYLGFIWRRV